MMTTRNEDEKLTIMHRKIFSTRALTTITVGVTAESAITLTDIVGLSLISSTSCTPALIVIVHNLFRRKKGHD